MTLRVKNFGTMIAEVQSILNTIYCQDSSMREEGE